VVAPGRGRSAVIANYNPDQPRGPGGRWESGSNAVAKVVAVTLVASAVAGGGVGGAVSASEALGEPGIPRTVRSHSKPRTSITNITDDTFRATVRLEKLGRFHPTFEGSFDDSQCAAHSDGAVQQFFTDHRCCTLTRGFVEFREKNYVILVSIATVDMCDYATTTELHMLLSDPRNGGITQLSRERGRYRDVAFTNAPTWWSRGETSLTIVQTQPVGRGPGAPVLNALIFYYLNSLS
jgi:hypothetical protein